MYTGGSRLKLGKTVRKCCTPLNRLLKLLLCMEICQRSCCSDRGSRLKHLNCRNPKVSAECSRDHEQAGLGLPLTCTTTFSPAAMTSAESIKLAAQVLVGLCEHPSLSVTHAVSTSSRLFSVPMTAMLFSCKQQCAMPVSALVIHAF